jgi:hypothetical protein
VYLPDGLREIPNDIFRSCNLDSVIIPNTVKRIGKNAFHFCWALRTIQLPEGLETIDDYAFYMCPFSGIKPLTSSSSEEQASIGVLQLPSSLKHIGKYAFAENRSLISIVLPNSVKTIGDFAFVQTKNLHRILKTIVIPASVEEMGNMAFWFGASDPDMLPFIEDDLRDVYCHLEIPVNNYNLFGDVTEQTLHVPAQSVELYRNSSYWKNFKEILPLNDDEVALDISAFNQATDGDEIHYSLSGNIIDATQKGIHIIKYKNGTVRKVVRR